MRLNEPKKLLNGTIEQLSRGKYLARSYSLNESRVFDNYADALNFLNNYLKSNMFKIELIPNSDKHNALNSFILVTTNKELEVLEKVKFHGGFLRFQIDVIDEVKTRDKKKELSKMECFLGKVFLPNLKDKINSSPINLCQHFGLTQI